VPHMKKIVSRGPKATGRRRAYNARQRTGRIQSAERAVPTRASRQTEDTNLLSA
jgi:hypothetical protein